MYCVVIYGEILKQDVPSSSSINIARISSFRSKGSVSSGSAKLNEKYGENRTLYINPNCRAQILIDFLYDATGIDKSQTFDLCDVNGILMNLRTLNEWEYATKVLDHQHTYYIILYEHDENGRLRIEPLLKKSSKTNTELLAILQRRLGSNVTISSKDKSPRKKASELERGSASKKRLLKPRKVKMSKSALSQM